MSKPYTQKTDSSAKVMGVPVSSASSQSLLSFLTKHLSSSKPQKLITIATPNPEQIMLAQRDDVFRSVLNSFSIRIPDGVGLVWAINRRNPKTRAARTTGIDFAYELIKLCQESSQGILLLGGRSTISTQASVQLKRALGSSLKISATPGYEDIRDPQETEEVALLELIQKQRPSLILVGFGAPWQELWIHEHKALLESTGVKIAMVVGGSFDVWARRLQRAPKVMQNVGLEWLFRLAQEPRRISRQLRLVEFVWRVVKSSQTK